VGRLGGIMIEYEKRINLIVCHGVGNWYYEDGKAEWFQPMYKNILNFSSKISKGKITEDFFNVYSVDWGSKAQVIQDIFRDKYRTAIEKNKSGFGPWNWLMNKITKGASDAIISSIGDVIMSFNEMQWKFFRGEVKETLKAAVIESQKRREIDGLPENSQTLTILVGHSLGSIILFKFCHEIGRNSFNTDLIEKTRKGLKFNTLITYGSPCSYFDWLSASGIKPKFPEEEILNINPKWINFYSVRDPLSSPIVPFFTDFYKETEVELYDKHIWFLGKKRNLPFVAHTKYATSRNLGRIIGLRMWDLYKALHNEA
jgi:hypothetical protein